MRRSNGTGHDSERGMTWIPGGRFKMGSDAHYPEERPVQWMEVAGFWMDIHPVTNRMFAAFTDATGYVTVAERVPTAEEYPGARPEMLVAGSIVFKQPRAPVPLPSLSWWAYVPGADWRHPEGPESSLSGREDHPVVHVAYDDASAYARWAGKSLPSEAQWERAARGTLLDAPYAWGETLLPEGRRLANIWIGDFPWHFDRPGRPCTEPVGTYPPNTLGLRDMIGNVWEWTEDWYIDRAARAPSESESVSESVSVSVSESVSCCAAKGSKAEESTRDRSFDVRAPFDTHPRKVLKGGSFLCSENYCRRYRPAARHPEPVDSASNHIGFRCVKVGARADPHQR